MKSFLLFGSKVFYMWEGQKTVKEALIELENNENSE
jgi:hypothetical protein